MADSSSSVPTTSSWNAMAAPMQRLPRPGRRVSHSSDAQQPAGPEDPQAVGQFSDRCWSERANVGRFEALAALGDFELHGLAFDELLEARTGNVGEVHEQVVAVLSLDESESLLVVEELDDTCCHLNFTSVFARERRN